MVFSLEKHRVMTEICISRRQGFILLSHNLGGFQYDVLDLYSEVLRGNPLKQGRHKLPGFLKNAQDTSSLFFGQRQPYNLGDDARKIRPNISKSNFDRI